MSLSDIKYIYQDKIDNVDARIDRYNGIIQNYDIKIKRAENEETPNISSVLKAKADYEHKIKNMECVREYYQEFVDTADYLMQFINNNNSHLLIREKEDLQNQLDDLQKKYDYLVASIEGNSNQINSLTGKLARLTSSNNSLKANVKYYKERYLEAIQLETVVEELECKISDLKLFNDVATKKNKNLLKINKRLHKQLDEDSIEEEKLIQQLRQRNQQLEDYCNHLLSRRLDEPLQMEVKVNKNIFDEIRSGAK